MISNSMAWLVLGMVFVAIEALGVSGVGFFFAGVAAICVGVVVELAWVAPDALIVQVAIFLLLTVVWAYLLWKPLKKLKMSLGKADANYTNMIGDVAIVTGSGLSQGSVGDVIWSGTIMKAELAKSAGDITVTTGSQVVITEVRGVTLIVEPK